MEWLLMILTLFRLWVAGQNALFYPIDRERKSTVERGQCPIADCFYRVLRVVWCILIAGWATWLAPYGIACYLLARAFKKFIFYSYYELD